MTEPKQSEALRLADEWQRKTQREADRKNSAYDHYGMGNTPETVDPLGAKMAAELRRLHAENERLAALVEAQQSAKAENLRQILTDTENQPNQYGVQFLMRGPKMAFKIGARQFTLDYEPDEPGEFEFMRDALISAFSIFTPDVKMAQQPAIMPKGESAAAQLRAMATNYPAGHLWDKLDANACIRGALEIEALRASHGQAPAPAAVAGPSVYVAAHECAECNHVGINDEHEVDAACYFCGWNGVSPDEDRCPSCKKDGAMTAACPKCSGAYWLLADANIAAAPTTQPAPVAQGDAAQPRLTVRLTSFPESNGKRNWAAMLVRAEKFAGLLGNVGGITIADGELWNRVAYAAECARFLIGERDTEPCIFDYGNDIQTPDEWQGETRRAARAQAKEGGA